MKAQTIFKNGKIYTVNKSQPWVEAVAIKDGKFLTIGSNEECDALVGSTTKVVDLNGRFVMPGIHDVHLHPDSVTDYVVNLEFSPELSWPEIQQTIETYAKENLHKKWVWGGTLPWITDNQLGDFEGVPSHKSILDELVPDRPVFFSDIGGHAALVNTRALEAAGIHSGTKDPEGGTIEKDEIGEPTGVLRELAANLVLEIIEPVDEITWTQALTNVIHRLNALGITSIKDAYGTDRTLKAYKHLDDRNDLSIRVAVAIAHPVDVLSTEKKEIQQQLIISREAFTTDRINPNYVKFILDGSAGGQTIVMIDPYEGTDFRGELRNPKDVLMQEIARLDKMGVGTMLHAVGDGAIRLAIDAIENARKKNGETSARHQIAHSVFINPEDRKRYAENSIIAEFSPYFWFPTPGRDIIQQDIGRERTNWAFSVKEIVESGAPVAAGSDWPVVEEPNPWVGIETMVTRQIPGAEGEAWNVEYAVSLDKAIEIFTLGGAYAMNQEHKTGSIKVGKAADMIVLSHNLFEIPKGGIHKTQVLLTLLDGQVIYDVES